MHTSFPEELVLFEYVPALHFVHELMPNCELYVPAGHIVHSDIPMESAYVFMLQLVHEWVLPVTMEYVPKPQSVHAEVPVPV